MSDKNTEIIEIGQLAVTAGNLLLNEPEEFFQEGLKQSGYTVSQQPVVQQFYDRLGIPQSGLYLPPYEHVFRKGYQADGVYHFPPAHHDGGVDVEAIYSANGFHLNDINTSVLFKGANIPGDHLGFMLVFTGSALQKIGTEKNIDERFVDVIHDFINNHLDDWVDRFCQLLPPENDRGYLKALADAVQEAVDMIRCWHNSELDSMIPIPAIKNA